MLDLTHENINPFIGAVIQTGNNLAIFQYCPKGSLQVREMSVLILKITSLSQQVKLAFTREVSNLPQYGET